MIVFPALQDRGARAGDVLLWVRETINHPLHEFQLLIRKGVALPLAAHGEVCLLSVKFLVGYS